MCTEEVREVTMPGVSLDNSLDDPDVVVVESDNIPEGTWSGPPLGIHGRDEGTPMLGLVSVPECSGVSGSSLEPSGLGTGGLRQASTLRTGEYDVVNAAASGESRVMSGEQQGATEGAAGGPSVELEAEVVDQPVAETVDPPKKLKEI